jgi:formate dehydrogenase
MRVFYVFVGSVGHTQRAIRIDRQRFRGLVLWRTLCLIWVTLLVVFNAVQHRFTSCLVIAQVVVALYPDPVKGYPPKYARDSIPRVTKYSDGQTAPTPQSIDFTPGDLLGCVSGELGLRKFLESHGHTLVVTSDKDGSGCQMERELHDAEIVISQPFWPFYLTKVGCVLVDCRWFYADIVLCGQERIAMAPKLKMAVTAGIGSDHVDLSVRFR